ncbi:hypothetical protein CPB84DRAFT_1857181 [Gymnopilus junonius]|uniref:Uncharacterized protein n=1 Tax=Gymnopilus junonius TaxID=109634 RepID=A0A9P5N6M5_GYMJU|nr:hypothetical protein CPB84DRAFT_1857181 [Gymnopilus junonius]
MTVLKSIKTQKTPRTLATYVSDAAKFCLLAAGAIVAATGLRSDMRGLMHDIVLRINYLLRCPNPDNSLGKLVIQDIIPVISILRGKFHITLSTLFSLELLISKGVIPEIEAGALERSDEFFDSITYNAFIKNRCIQTWRTCYNPLHGLITPYHLINHSVLSSMPSSTQYPGRINLSEAFNVPSLLSSLGDDSDEEDLNINTQKSLSKAELYIIKTN